MLLIFFLKIMLGLCIYLKLLLCPVWNVKFSTSVYESCVTCVCAHVGACLNAGYRKVWQIPYCKSWKEQKCDVAKQVLLLFSVILKPIDTI